MVEYYSAGKSNKLQIHATLWVDLNGITLKKANVKGLHTVGFYYYDIHEVTEYSIRTQISSSRSRGKM